MVNIVNEKIVSLNNNGKNVNVVVNEKIQL